MTQTKRPEPHARRSWSDLQPRIVSALVLVPVTVVALLLGGVWLALLIGATFGGVYREWDSMVSGQRPGWLANGLSLLVFCVPVVDALFGVQVALYISGAMAVVVLIVPGARIWRLVGIVYLSLVVMALVAIRGTDVSGIYAGVFLGLAVWMTDSGAFFSGRLLGGAKLSPEISPSKTWSGATGGLVIGALSAFICWGVAGGSPLWLGFLFALLLSVAGQLGDLMESAIKRRFKIKDSGDIIPGHGGLMDRLDSLSFAALVMFIIGAGHLGIGEVAHGFLYW